MSLPARRPGGRPGPRRGRIETGLLADLIAVKGNPLEDVRLLEDVRFVMKGGVVFKQPD